MEDEGWEPERKRRSKSQPLAEVPHPGGPRAIEPVSGATEQDAGDAYALALKAIERLFLEQQARITAEMETARAAAEESDFTDYRRISRAATRAARVSWEADDQMAALKQRLDELYQKRVIEPIMELRRLSTKMEERNRKRFRRRIGDRL